MLSCVKVPFFHEASASIPVKMVRCPADAASSGVPSDSPCVAEAMADV